MHSDREDNLFSDTSEIELDSFGRGWRRQSDMWRAVVLFVIFIGTTGLALLPPARLPILLSIFRSPQNESKTFANSASGQKTHEGRAEKSEELPSNGLLWERGAPSLSAERAEFGDRASQVIQATPIPPGFQSLATPGHAQISEYAWSSVPITSAESEIPAPSIGSGDRSPIVQAEGHALGGPPWQRQSGQLLPFTATEKETPAVNPGVSPTYLPGDARGDGRPAGMSDGSSDDPSLQDLAARFQALGAVRYRLERWGEGLYRFTCETPIAGATKVTRLWEAIGPSPKQVMEEVLQRLLAEKASQAGTN